MKTLNKALYKMDVEKMFITVSVVMMEGFGMVALICGILGVQIF